MGRLEGKNALVLGASRAGNMGQAIARRFIAEGAKVAVSGRGQDGIEAFADEYGAVAIECDVSSKASVFSMMARFEKEIGPLHVAVNAAATGQYGAFEETSEAEIDEMLAIIFKGGFFFMQAAVGAMKRAGGGSIADLTSQVATMMFENHAAYMGAKAGLEHVTRTVANEFGQYNIRANNVAPGLTITPMTEGVMVPGMAEAFARETPLGRLNTIDDIAAVTLFAVSDECFMTGQTFHTTGGIDLRKLPSAVEIAASIEAAAR
ncbi:SDR family oxidoreductase [Novosphingobium sp. G106]|uniref:SDR family NAD(P)-dependent oxidoreductase n=1 Tax=Novosphingobium sp. G106 TaxID=2849500 RepID=UPI001C2D932D|nr:SDR family oxidoreductase [Novosphingobium sp. G106]MBV1688909.1 SDR family oxidoreductase [Novosphingobium sp. G106]